MTYVIANKCNEAIHQHPVASGIYLFASDIVSVGITYGMFTLWGFQASPEFALAFAVSRPLRKIRLPLELLVARQLAKTVPALAEIQLSALVSPLVSNR